MKSKNILIIENLDTHTPLVVTLVNLFNKNNKLNPFVLISPRNHKEISINFKDFSKQNKERIFVYEYTPFVKGCRLRYKLVELKNSIIKVGQAIRIINKNDIDTIFLNTPEAERNIWLMTYFLFTKRQIALIHHDSLLNTNDRKLGKIFLFLFKKVIKKSVFSIFLGDYQKEDLIFSEKKHIFINYVYDKNPNKKIKKYNKLTFVINSTPKIANRDYEMVFKNFNEIISKNKLLKKKIKIIIPLKIKSSEILQLIKKYNLSLMVKTFDRYVLEKELVDILKRSHYSIIPFYPHSEGGRSRISASISYACAFRLPIITPAKYFENAKDKSKYKYVRPYNFGDDSFKQLIKKLISEKYDREKIGKEFEEYNKMYNFKNINNQINKFLK